MPPIELKRYKKEYEHSYSFGVFPTVELIKFQPGHVAKVFTGTKGERNEGVAKIRRLCREAGIEVEVNDKVIDRLAPNENSYAVGVFHKYSRTLDSVGDHVVLVNPSDMGNMGTIMRTMLGFGLRDLAIVRPAVDVFDPRVVRASMGALFQLSFQYFDTFDEYQARFKHSIYTFMTNGQVSLQDARFEESFSLVFGSEGAGLPDEFVTKGTSVTIPHSDRIDSLNLPVAVSIALYEATKNSFRDR